MRQYQTAVISALALIQGGGLLLITLGLISGAGAWILAGGGAAAVLMVVARPTKEELGRSAPPSTSR